MKRRFFMAAFLFLYAISAPGCIAVLAGAAGGAGTATWLSGKLVQEVAVSFDKVIAATELGLEALDLDITKKTVKGDVAQIMAEYSDGSTVWVDIRRVLTGTSKIEVRVGVRGDKEAARKILDQIEKHL
ncbi:MAG: DUF3568 family protein [Candidatus Omnitrophota bacterium]